MKCLLVAVAVVLGWTTFAGNTSRSFYTEKPIWPPFLMKWSINLGPPGTRVTSPVTAEKIRIVKYIRRDNCHMLYLKAFDDSGKQIWSFEKDLGTKIIFQINTRDFEGSPTIANGMVFFTTTKTLAAITLDEGKLVWEYQYELQESQEIAYVNPLVYGEGGQIIVVVTVGKNVFLHDGYNGKVFAKSDNFSDKIPPVLLSNQSTLSPVHLDSFGKKLAQLPAEALKQKGGYAVSDDFLVAYYLNACWKAWRYDRKYNRWDKAWMVEDKTDQPSPFWSYRHATITGDRILLSMPKKLVCTDFDGNTIWEYESPLCQWNQSVPVAGNVALLTAFVKSKVLQAIDVRDGLLYPAMELPLYPMASPVPTDSGFMVVSSGATFWEFSSALPPKVRIYANSYYNISNLWDEFDFPLKVTNVGGSRMTFTMKSQETTIVGGMTRCNPGMSVVFKVRIKKMTSNQRVSVTAEGDGGTDSVLVFIQASENLPNKRDVNLDGVVDKVDFIEVFTRLGQKAVGKAWNVSRRCDLDNDNIIGLSDLMIMGRKQ